MGSPAGHLMNNPWQYIRHHLKSGWNLWWKSTLAITFLILIPLCIHNLFDSDSEINTLLLFASGVFVLGFHVGIATFLIAMVIMAYRVVGAALLIPILVTPLFATLLFWLASGLIDHISNDLVLAAGNAIAEHGGGRGGGGHGMSGGLVVIVLAWYAWIFLTSWTVMSNALLLLLTLITILSIAIGLSVAVSAPPLIKSTRRRYRGLIVPDKASPRTGSGDRDPDTCQNSRSRCGRRFRP